MTNHNSSADQLGFDMLITEADDNNRARKFANATGHLPATWDEALPFFRALIDRHHAAMLAADVEEVLRLNEEAHLLARKLNGGEAGILAHDNAPGYVLSRETAAPSGTVPLWGQSGDFVVTVGNMRVQVELDGMFGIGSCHSFWPGFAVRAVDFDRPFLSQTGYRSFLGIYVEPQAGLTPDTFICNVLASYVETELNGKLLSIDPRYRDRGS